MAIKKGINGGGGLGSKKTTFGARKAKDDLLKAKKANINSFNRFVFIPQYSSIGSPSPGSTPATTPEVEMITQAGEVLDTQAGENLITQ